MLGSGTMGHGSVACTLRTMEEQAALYAQGREDIAAVNALRRLAGMPPVGVEANRIVTRARPGQFNAPLRARLRRCASGLSLAPRTEPVYGGR